MYELRLSSEHLLYIGEALGRCPYKEVVAIINTLQAQASEQDQAKLAKDVDCGD
jgi:hypothetical protein